MATIAKEGHPDTLGPSLTPLILSEAKRQEWWARQ